MPCKDFYLCLVSESTNSYTHNDCQDKYEELSSILNGMPFKEASKQDNHFSGPRDTARVFYYPKDMLSDELPYSEGLFLINGNPLEYDTSDEETLSPVGDEISNQPSKLFIYSNNGDSYVVYVTEGSISHTWLKQRELPQKLDFK